MPRKAAPPGGRTTGRVQTLTRALCDWYAQNAADFERQPRKPDSEAALQRLEKTLGHPLPEDLRTFLATRTQEAGYFEYQLLDAKGIALNWKLLTGLLKKGSFAKARPARRTDPRLTGGWWQPGFIPFAEDSGGNLFCVDVAPGPRGKVGQVVRWERSEGPVVDRRHASFTAFLQAYLDDLEAGRFEITDAGMFRTP
jgi:cell wall assembly regulator SMI1